MEYNLVYLSSQMGEGIGGVKVFHDRDWTEGQVHPAGNLTTPVQAFSKLTLASCVNVVAIIPNDDAGWQAAQKAFED